MSKKGPLMALFLGLVCAFCLEAATVSFLVVETGLSAGAASNQHSGLWESGLLDVFFEAGHIVSNAPVMRLSEKPAGDFPDEARAEFDEAAEGGVEYFIIALLDYDASENPRPQNVSLRMFKMNPFKKIFEQQYADKTSKNIADEFENLKKIARGLVPHLNDR
jgi:hypothetical protein